MMYTYIHIYKHIYIHTQMMLVKRVYSEYKERLHEIQRREDLCEVREKEMRNREEQVSRYVQLLHLCTYVCVCVCVKGRSV